MLWLARFRRLAWFQTSAVGGFPWPDRGPGWAAFVVFIALIAATVRLDGETAWLARIALAAAYVALSYLTLGPDDEA